jgi:CheY-like chemotaxis protein
MDDDEALRTLSKAVLSHLGYDAHLASDGAEAIALYETAKATGKGYDAVLLDLTVTGGMGGLEAAAKLKELDPTAKLIVSSGYSDAPAMSCFAEYGFDAVLVKPWTVKEMSDVLRRVLTTNSMQAPR